MCYIFRRAGWRCLVCPFQRRTSREALAARLGLLPFRDAGILAPFDPLPTRVVPFEFGSGPFWNEINIAYEL